MSDWLAELRPPHSRGTLSEADVAADPFAQFNAWLTEAHHAGIGQPNAMTLSTVDADGLPDARIVLLKGFDSRGLVFYTHRTSRKGTQLGAVPHAALTFWWDALERQVRVRGLVQWTSDAESDEYFGSRPRGSQLSAMASPQSQVVADRATLEQRLSAIEERVNEQAPTRPPTWGGYRVVPAEFEFWQGRPNRLHDRIRYRLDAHRAWIRERLAP